MSGLSVDSTSGDPSLKFDLWSLICREKSTQYASMKVLQRFVLSLSREELCHVIQTYLRATIGRHRHSYYLSLRATADELVNGKDGDQRRNKTIDGEIMKKMEFGTRSNQKVIRKLRQKNGDNKNLLTINPHVLASSFQYLTYKELCKINRTSAYFVYLTKSFPALCHYYIDLDKKLLSKAIHNTVNITNLKNFNHISISHGYQGKSEYYPNVKRRTDIFQRILVTTLRQSANTCRALTVDITKSAGCSRTHSTQMMMEFLLRNIELPNLAILNWNHDDMGTHRGSMPFITGKRLSGKWPNLQSISFGLRVEKGWTMTSEQQSLSLLTQCMHSIISMSTLISLELQCPRRCLFAEDMKIIENLSAMGSLRKLTLCSLIPALSELPVLSSTNLSVQELSVRLVIRGFANIGSNIFGANIILEALMSTFIGTTNLEFYGIGCTKPYGRYDGLLVRGIKQTFDWQSIFSRLFQKKNDYAMKNGEIRALQAINLKQMSKEQAVAALKALRGVGGRHYDLNSVSLDIVFGIFTLRERTLDYEEDFGYDDFVKNHLIHFLQCNQSILKQIRLRYGGRFEQYLDTCHKWTTVESYYEMESKRTVLGRFQNMYGTELHLLRNLPSTLQSLCVEPPWKRRLDASVKDKSAEEMVSELCRLSVEKDQHQLYSVILKGIKLPAAMNEYLTFMFGFNNRFQNDHDSYSMIFR